MKLITVIFGTVLCAALYHQVLGDGVTKCYTCELTDTTCEKEKETKCADTVPGGVNITWACLTTSVTSGDATVTAKQCVEKTTAEDVCKEFNDKLPEGADASCTVCNEDLCNSAGIYSISFLLLSSLFLLTKLL